MASRSSSSSARRGCGLSRRFRVDQHDGCDRTTTKHLERIRRDTGEERTWQSRKRTRHGLPRRIHVLQEEATKAKGLK
jgi:hypothetical protein